MQFIPTLAQSIAQRQSHNQVTPNSPSLQFSPLDSETQGATSYPQSHSFSHVDALRHPMPWCASLLGKSALGRSPQHERTLLVDLKPPCHCTGGRNPSLSHRSAARIPGNCLISLLILPSSWGKTRVGSPSK